MAFNFPNWINSDTQGVNFGLTNQMPPELALEEQALNRKQQLANTLYQRALQPIQGQMAGRFYAGPSWAQGLAQLGTAGAGAYLTHQNAAGRRDLANQSQKMLSDALAGYQSKIAQHEVETAPADTRQVNGTEGIDPNVMPSQGWDINTYQPDTFNQVQANKNALAMALEPPPQQQAPLAGNPQNFNPFTMEPVGALQAPPQEQQMVSPLQEAMDRGMQYTRQPFSQPQSQVTVSPAQSQMMERTPQEKQAALVELMASQHPQARAIAQMMMQQQMQQAEHAATREFQAKEHSMDRQVKREGISESAAARMATIQNTMAMREMDIAARERAGQDASSLKRELAEMQGKLQKELHAMDIEGKKDIAGMVQDRKDERNQLSPTAQKELFDTDEQVLAGKNVITALDQAMALNDKAYDGVAADTRAAIASNVPGVGKEGADATVALNNLITNQALGQLKATFGSMPTEGERKILLEVQGSVNLKAAQRKEIWDRAKIQVQKRLDFNEKKAREMRDGSYFKQQGMQPQAAPSAPTNGGWSITPIP